MPANTANRSYPYSIPGDPAKIPAALQALAEAVNDDVQALEDLIGARPMARVRGTTPMTMGGLQTVLPVTWDTVDFNVNGAIGTLTTNQTEIVPQLPGLWLAVATINYPQPGSGTIEQLGLEIVRGLIVGSTTTHRHPTIAQGTVKLDSLALHFCDGVSDDFLVNSLVDRSSGTATQQIRDRSLTLFRMTQS